MFYYNGYEKEREVKINKYQVAPERNGGILFRNKKTQEKFHNPQHNSSTNRNVSRREFFASFTIHNDTHFDELYKVGCKTFKFILTVWLKLRIKRQLVGSSIALPSML
ncbi:hypothetical protein ACKWTF_011742 [Chironomus riparius]